MNKTNQPLTSLAGRALIYISIFILGAALHELCLQVMHPALRSSGALLLTVITLIAFVLAGALLARKGQMLSRIVSASTLLVLGFIALRIGHASVSDSYLLVAALGVAVIGAQLLCIVSQRALGKRLYIAWLRYLLPWLWQLYSPMACLCLIVLRSRQSKLL